MAGDTRANLLNRLKQIKSPGTFCVSGELPTTFPGLEVTGLGPVGLPLVKQQAEALKQLARQAPYGKGAQTLVDTDVRNVWEIDVSQVRLTNPRWAGVVNQTLATVQSELGLEKQKLGAHLYKLLIYEPGSFFLAHRDGERLDRMVATLVITLPSAHDGGELIVRHDGQTKTVDFGPQSEHQAQFAAFYADCEHEVRPVTSGIRLALVYNLTLEKSTKRVTAPTTSEHIAEVARTLDLWRQELEKQTARFTSGKDSDKDRPNFKLAVILDHEYTETGLTFDTLKGIDRTKADVLMAAARQAGCDASLALVTKHVSGSAEGDHDYDYGSRRGRYDEDEDEAEEEDDDGGSSEYEMGEVYDESQTAENFSDADGNKLNYGQIPLDDAELVMESPFSEEEPDEEEYEGYTGNEGMTLERWYHRAAIIIWPSDTRFDVLCEAGMKAAVGGLEQMIRRWKEADKEAQDALLLECHHFAHRIIACWPEVQFHSSREDDYDWDASDADETDAFLTQLKKLGNATLISEWIRGVLARDVSVNPGRMLGTLCKKHDWESFRDDLIALFKSSSNETFERHAGLLYDWSTRSDKNVERIGLCVKLAGLLIAALEDWKPEKAKKDWRSREVKHVKLLPLLTKALLALDERELLERLVLHVLARTREFDLTSIQMPVLRPMKAWLEKHVNQASPPLKRWLTAVQTELASRASNPPRAPADWQRVSDTGCSCNDCKALSEFLKDPLTKTKSFPMAEARRKHIHQVINGKMLDTTHVTERKGSPYSLVCTKTQASYERALKAHHVDLRDLENVGALLEWHAGLKH